MPDAHTETRTASEVAELLDRLRRASHALQFVHGLNPAQWEALRFLGRANRYSRSPSTLAEYLGTTKGTASQTLRALETKGYVERCRDCADRRGVSVELTAKGRELLLVDPMLGIERAVEALPRECGEHLAKGLAVVLGKIRGSCRQGAFGVCERCRHLVAEGVGQTTLCGLTGEPLSKEDAKLLCVNFGECAEARATGSPAAAS
ncbi:MAG TPA: MarR family transcriptional regulator [Alphaproteobacteria bacterium]|nr:MarR family transcriptional regulator [Alphaproteobacteria bacterium]